MIIIAYFILIRQSLGINSINSVLDKMQWELALYIYLLFPAFCIFLAYLSNQLRLRRQLEKRPTGLKIVIVATLLVIFVNLPYIEYIHANQDYICQTCFKPTRISSDEIDRNSNFYWLGTSLLLFLVSDFVIQNKREIRSESSGD